MKETKHPKVFISYAWGTEDYQQKVLAFASELKSHRVDVVLDKWHLQPGQDVYNFMEKSVKDPEINFVLILCDKNYAEKANDRKGGVGTETLIISQQVYEDAEQEKFIPVVFERDEKGRICKPLYINSRYHFDLSIAEKYADEYKKLVRYLYGIKVYPEPELGDIPEWLYKDNQISAKTITDYDILKKNIPEKVKVQKFVKFLSNIEEELLNIGAEVDKNVDSEQYLELYTKEVHNIRNKYLQLVKTSLYVRDNGKYLAEFFESFNDKLLSNKIKFEDIVNNVFQEIIIYTIAILYKNKDYESITHILCKGYIVDNSSGTFVSNFTCLHRGDNDQKLNNILLEKYGKYGNKPVSPLAKFWIESLNMDFCLKEEFVFADILCANYSVFGNVIKTYPIWFPRLYIYGNPLWNFPKFRNFAKRLCCKGDLEDISKLFGFSNVEDFKSNFKDSVIKYSDVIKDFRYPNSFERVPFLSDYVKYEDLGRY